MSSIEENQNALELLKQALMFYANSDNYKQTQPVSNNYELFSMIEMDNGSQARFALEQLEKIQTITQNAEEEFVKEVTSAIEDGVETDNVLNLIEQYKEKLENDSNV
jgi:multidrug efflux pump subunit AcrB